MIVQVSMKNSEDKFHVYEWWATTPETVLDFMSSQLTAAKAIWPHALSNVGIGEISKAEGQASETSGSSNSLTEDKI